MEFSGNFSKWIDYAGEPRRLGTGDVLFDRELPGDCMYIVTAGTIEVRQGERVLESVGRGGIVGEMALIDDMPRSASAVAAEDSELVPIDRNHFLFLVQETPTFALEVMHLVASRLRRVNQALD